MHRAELRELLRHAIADIQGSIHANDSKSAAGLVVQGLLATAVVTLSSHFGSIYDEATSGARILIKVALIATLVLGGLSIACLILAVVPYKPKQVFIDRNFTGRGRVYFPEIDGMKTIQERGGPSELTQLRERYAALDNEDDLDTEYLSELLMVADIRFKQAQWAKRGFFCLGLEVVFVILFLTTSGAVAGHMLGATTAKADPAIRWEIIEGRHRRSLTAVDDAVLSRPTAQIRVQAKDSSGEHYFKLTRSATYRCRERDGADRLRRAAPSIQNARLFGAQRAALVERVSLAEFSCPTGRHPSEVSWRLEAALRSESGPLTSGLLQLYAGSEPNPGPT